MTDLSQMLRWNANFVRGLAQSVLERAKVIRSTLTPYASSSEPIFTVQTKGGKKAKLTVKKSPKKATKKTVKTAARKSKRTNA